MRNPGKLLMMVGALAMIWAAGGCATGQKAGQTPELVRLEAQDGAVIFANRYGSGTRGVVLVHGGRFKKESWDKQARELAGAGFQVLAIDLRGYGNSKGPGQENIFTAPTHFDVLAAVDYLHAKGASSVSAIGGSLGGDGVANAVIAGPGRIDRIVILGAAPECAPERLDVPQLYIITRNDSNAAGPRLPTLQAFFDKARDPKELIILEGDAHAQFMFQSDQADRVMREIIRFLSA